MATATINGAQLYYEVKGSGTPLLLIAGLAADSHTWQPVIKELARHFLVITLDNRGAGRSGAADEISIKQMADDCFGLVRHLGFSSVNLLGHCMGGLVAQNCAVRYPGIVTKLVLVSTAARNSHRNNALFSDWASALEAEMEPALWFRNLFYWTLSRRFFDNEASVRAAVRAAIEYPHAQSKLSFRSQVNAVAAFDGRRKLSRISAKTLVIGGKEDLLFPADDFAALAASISGASLATIDNAAHSIHVENPRAFTESILGFLAAR
jgi:pimeloyl-ACP methyl ester carboxylesterase